MNEMPLLTSCCLIYFDGSKFLFWGKSLLSGDIQNAGRVFQRSHWGLLGVGEPPRWVTHAIIQRLEMAVFLYYRNSTKSSWICDFRESISNFKVISSRHGWVGFCIGMSPNFHLFEVSWSIHECLIPIWKMVRYRKKTYIEPIYPLVS